MINFQYYNPSKVIFGQGSHQNIKQLLKDYNVTSLFFIYGGRTVKRLGIWDTVSKACEELGIKFTERGGVVPNPKIEHVRELIKVGKENNVDFVLAAGGGSSMDTAKAVSVGIPYEGDVWNFFEGKDSISSALPIGVISTIPASGSETSNCSIISNGLYKLGIESDFIIPKFAIMNPEFTLSLPQYQTSCGIADIFSHLLERYFTNTKYVDTTDYLIEGACKALILNAQRLMENPNDINARSEIQWLASIAHNNLLDTGRVPDWGSHRIEHELSAQYGLTHGEGMAIVLVAWTKYMAYNKPSKLAQLANRLFNIDYSNYSEEEMALKLSHHLEDFFISLNLNTKLSQKGITDEHFELMAMRATNNNQSTVGNYIPLDASKFVDILKLAL